MNPTDENADRVWESTLPRIRQTRRQRGRRRMAMAAMMSACLLSGGFWLLSKPSPGGRSTAGFIPPAFEMEETIAVMKVAGDGRVRLEEIPVSDFGSVELAFGLTQLVSDDLPD